MDQVIQAVVTGLSLGLLYAAVAVGLSLVLGILGVINIAHSALLMLAALSAWEFIGAWHLDPFVTLVMVVILFGFLGWLIERTLMRRLDRESDLTVLLVLFGLMMVVETVSILLFSTDTYSVPLGYLSGTLAVGAIRIPVARLVGGALTLVILLGVDLFLSRTLIGTAIRALPQNPDVARSVGIPIRRLMTWVFAGGVALAAFGGVVLAFSVPISPQTHIRWLAWAFLVVILGGLGSVRNTLVAGLALGLVEAIAGLLLPFSYVYLVVYGLLVLALLFRQEGLGGKATRAL